MRRFSTLPRASKALAGVALLAACWPAVPAASDTNASDVAADGDGITAALAAVAIKLTATVFTDSTSAAGSSRAAAPISAAPSSGSASSRAATPNSSASSSGSAHSRAAAAVLTASASGSTSSRTAQELRSPAAEPPAPRPRRLAVVRGSVALRETPGGPAVVRVGSTTEFGSPRVLAVAARRGDWLGVVATERPNNRLGWVRRDNPALKLRRTGWSLHADLSDRTLTLRKDGRRVHRLAVAIGRPGSETPTGRFAVTDKLSGSNYGPYYGCCILALSGHQPRTPPGWTGGDRLAIHGTDAPSTIGMAASAGCLRASDGDLRVLMAKVPLGATVFIRR
jgi:L,D-transpeptidase-like protein